MKVITAPELSIEVDKCISVFLAGGITKCHRWQDEVIDYLYKDESIKSEEEIENILNV